MARPAIKQPMPLIGEPLAVINHPALGGRLEIFPTEAYRVFLENSNIALFDDGATDVTLVVVNPLVRDVIGDTLKGLSVTGTPEPGFTVTLTLAQDIRTTASPVFAGLTINGSIAVSGTVDGRDPSIDGAKLDGIAAGATANAADAQLRDRATHTGAQAIATVTGLQTALDGKVTKDAIITAANQAHSLNATFNNVEVQNALNALGAIINEIRTSFNA